jgi:hypothetical protein
MYHKIIEFTQAYPSPLHTLRRMIKRTSKMTELIAVRMKPELRERIDEWRAKLRPIPSQGAAIRQLVEDGLEVHEKGEKPKGRKN